MITIMPASYKRRVRRGPSDCHRRGLIVSPSSGRYLVGYPTPAVVEAWSVIRCMRLCLCVRALKRNRLELSTPNFVYTLDRRSEWQQLVFLRK